MTTAYSPLLGLALPVTGELSGTWGDTVNVSITSLLDSAVAGTTTLSTDADVTLTTTTGAANTAREAILLFSGARTALRTITAPAASKIYTVINATTGGFGVKLVGAGPTTGLTIPAGASAVVAWNGSDFVEIGSTTLNSLTVTGNLTVNGTSTLTGAITNTAGTANGVAYLNGSKVLTTGSALWFDGTNFGVGTGGNSLNHQSVVYKVGANAVYQQIANGSTGLAATNGVRLGLTSGGTGELYSPTALISYIDNTEQMRLTSTGLGIGTSAPQRKLHVNATPGATYGDVARFESNGSAGPVTLSFGDSGTTSALPTIGGNGNSLVFGTGAATQMTLNLSGNLGLGVTPSAWGSSYKCLELGGVVSYFSSANQYFGMYANAYRNSGGSLIYTTTGTSSGYLQDLGAHKWFNAPSGTAGNAISFTQAMTLDASGNLLVGTTSSIGSGPSMTLKCPTAGQQCYTSWNATTSGNPYFHEFGTEASYVARGSITYNRAGGLVVYNTTSDYRAKDIYGVITDSGSVIDSVPVYMGKMKGATQERPMFIAHEVPAYAHTGEKDAVDADGNPVYQQMDASALVPVMWAEIQSLRKRLAAAGL